MTIKKFSVILYFAVIFTLFLWLILGPENEYSLSERRVLTGMPKVSVSDLNSGVFMEEFDSFCADQFPLRDQFRSLKALVSMKLLGQKDNHGVYMAKGYVSKLTYPINKENVKKQGQKAKNIIESYLKDTGCRTFVSVIPDKNLFLAEPNGYPSLDYEELTKVYLDKVDADYIDIFDLLSLEDYYNTDQHWRQEKIEDVADRLLDGMGAEKTDLSYKTKTLNTPFFGAYVGQLGLSVNPDKIRYLTNDILESCKVTSFDTGEPKDSFIYNLDKETSKEPYDIFLNGPDALIKIENQRAETDRKLIVFRDSFLSSLAPLLVPSYSEITLVDLRYIRPESLSDFIEFKDADVLFIHSTLVLNSPL